MAEFIPSKKTAQDFNNGQKYINGDGTETGDVINADMPNNVIEGFLYMQGLASNQPDISEANQVGTATASIITVPDGTARLKLSNLKGEKGDSGITDAGLSNTYGDSDTNGYTQKAVNGLVSNPNLLDNPDSAINQRGIFSSTSSGYMSDRWNKLIGNYIQVDIENGIYTITVLKNAAGYSWSRAFGQTIECPKSLWGKQITWSVNVLTPLSYSYARIQIHALKADKTILKASPASHGLQNAGITYESFVVPENTVYLQANISLNMDTIPVGSIVKYTEPKLELGTVPTKFLPPNPAEELLKCQRYYVDMCYQLKSSLSPYLVGSGLCYTATLAYFVVPIPTSMRVSTAQVSPIYDIEKLTVLSGNSTLPITALVVVGCTNTSISVRATGSFEIGNAALLRIAANENGLGILAFDAEI